MYKRHIHRYSGLNNPQTSSQWCTAQQKPPNTTGTLAFFVTTASPRKYLLNPSGSSTGVLARLEGLDCGASSPVTAIPGARPGARPPLEYPRSPGADSAAADFTKRASNAANTIPKLYTLEHDCLGQSLRVHYPEWLATGPRPCIRALSSACAPWISGDRLHLVFYFLGVPFRGARLSNAASLQEKMHQTTVIRLKTSSNGSHSSKEARSNDQSPT